MTITTCNFCAGRQDKLTPLATKIHFIIDLWESDRITFLFEKCSHIEIEIAELGRLYDEYEIQIIMDVH